MKISKLHLATMIAILILNGILFEEPGRAVQPGTVNCNGLQNFLNARKKYGRSRLPHICSRNFTWRGRIDCSKGVPVLSYDVSMADAEWICKKLIYARGDEIPYRELRALLIASGAIPVSSSSTGQAFKEVSCGNRLCTSTWILPDQSFINVTLRRDGDQLAIYE
jgi:hypothetical protein